MARIKKVRAHKPLVQDSCGVGMTNYREDGGLRFTISIGEYNISLTHAERDYVISNWARMEKEWLDGVRS